jgi:hypothetical protein
MNQMHTNATTELAKDYIAKRKIPQLFEVKLIQIEGKYMQILLGLNHWPYGS